MNEEKVILVNERDEQLGLMPKMEAHEKALLHRAFSVFIFRIHHGKRELLLQRRHPDKYHCGGLWSNTCCSHPRPDESITEAGQRRLQEEMGFVVPLQSTGHFIYKASFDNGLTEHEFDHVLIGYFNADITQFNHKEIYNVQWLNITAVQTQLKKHPENYTPWFSKALSIALK